MRYLTKKFQPLFAKTKNHGFTLIEMVVSLMVFSIALIAISAIFLSVTKGQNKTTILRRIQSESHYAFELISLEARDDVIDYSSLTANPETSLALIRRDGKKVFFYKGADNQLKMRIDAEAEKNILSNTIKVDNLKFFITPATDPFVPGGPDSQPRVTIALTLSENKANARADEKSSLKIQNTISLRVYRR